jgi:hypothetical protein
MVRNRTIVVKIIKQNEYVHSVYILCMYIESLHLSI